MYIPVLSSCVHKMVSDVESTFKNLHTFQSPPKVPVQRIIFPPMALKCRKFPRIRSGPAAGAPGHCGNALRLKGQATFWHTEQVGPSPSTC